MPERALVIVPTYNERDNIERLIAYCSSFTALAPGDVIVTGTPGGVGDRREPPVYLTEGDLVEVDIGIVGCLANRVAVG